VRKYAIRLVVGLALSVDPAFGAEGDDDAELAAARRR
jgi:hypothetical protein